MAEDPINQQAFAEDVAAAAAAGGPDGFAMPPGGGGGGPGSPDFKMPSADEIWKMVQSMEGISDEEREELRESIYNPKPPSPEDFMKQYGHPGHSSREYLVFFVMIALILLVFGKQTQNKRERPNPIHEYHKQPSPNVTLIGTTIELKSSEQTPKDPVLRLKQS